MTHGALHEHTYGRSSASTCSSSSCAAPTPPPTTPPALPLKVVIENRAADNVKVVQLSEDGKTRGANICDLKEDSACTVTDNFIVVSGDRAGDPFRQWWGDPSWKSAQVTLRVSEGPGNYLKYTKTSNEHEDYVVPDAVIFMDLDYTASPAQTATI